MVRLRALVLVVTLAGQTQVPPEPPKGEYSCTQLNLTTAMPLPGLPPSTTVTAAPGPFGNLVLDGAGQFRMTAGRNNTGTYRYDRATGRVIFDGVLAALQTSYSTRGRLLAFEFRGSGITFSCSLQGQVDSGESRAQGDDATKPPKSRPNSRFAGRVYYADHRSAFRVDLATGVVRPIGMSGNFDVRPDGTAVYITAAGEMILTDESGSRPMRVPVYGSKNYSPRFSPDGSRIAYHGGQKPAGMEAALESAFTAARLEPLVILRDGRIVAAFGNQYAQPCWTPDGRIVVAGARSSPGIMTGNTTGIFLLDPSLKRLSRLPIEFDAPHSPAVSPDGTKLAFVNGAHLWVTGIDGSAPRSIEGTRNLMFPAWSPDSKALTFVDDQVVGIVSLSGEELPVVTSDGTAVRSMSELVWLP